MGGLKRGTGAVILSAEMVRPPPPPPPPPPSRETDIAFGIILILCGIGLATILSYVATITNRYHYSASKATHFSFSRAGDAPYDTQ